MSLFLLDMSANSFKDVYAFKNEDIVVMTDCKDAKDHLRPTRANIVSPSTPITVRHGR